MGKEAFASIEEIDKALDEEFKAIREAEQTDGDDEEDVIDEELLDEDDEENSDDEDGEEDEDEEPVKPAAKPKKAEQEQYAFAQLRAKAEAAEKAAETERALMRKLARTAGFGDDVEGYRKELEKRLVEEEAKQRGITPEVYKELADAKAELEKIKQEKVVSEKTSSSQRFLETINSVLGQYEGIDAKELSRELFSNLEKAGYTIETLLAIPQPEFLIKGVLYDKLSKATIKEARIKGSVETKAIKSSSRDVKTVDELIEDEMAAYAKSRGLKYTK